MTQDQFIQRWDSFLQKMEQRFDESLLQAEEACLSLLVETDYDYNTVLISWQGMKAQINQLSTKIEETWQNQVKPQMIQVSDGDLYYEQEGRKANVLSDKLSFKMQRFQTILEGKLSQKFYEHASQIASQSFSCSQCGAPISIKKDLFRAQYVTCPACNSVNTFDPELKFLQIGWNVIDHIVAWQCLPLHDSMQQAMDELMAVRSNEQTNELWDNYKSAYFNYWQTYFQEIITRKPSAEDRFAQDMNRKRIEYEQFESIHRVNHSKIKQ